MTESEAITELKRKAYRTTCYGNKVLEHEENLVAIEALDKQIGKKPLSAEDDYGTAWYSCAECLGGLCNVRGFVDYCPNCGQKIDWEEENERQIFIQSKKA